MSDQADAASDPLLLEKNGSDLAVKRESYESGRIQFQLPIH